jgi:hypothetical protein
VDEHPGHGLEPAIVPERLPGAPLIDELVLQRLGVAAD